MSSSAVLAAGTLAIVLRGTGTAITVLICWALGGVILIGLAALRMTAHRRNAARHFGEPAVWLGAGAITLGIGAALAGGSGLAHADTAHAGGDGNSSGGGTGPAKTGSTSSAASANNRPVSSSVVAKTSRPTTPNPHGTPRRSVRITAAGTPAPEPTNIVVRESVTTEPNAPTAQASA